VGPENRAEKGKKSDDKKIKKGTCRKTRPSEKDTLHETEGERKRAVRRAGHLGGKSKAGWGIGPEIRENERFSRGGVDGRPGLGKTGQGNGGFDVQKKKTVMGIQGGVWKKAQENRAASGRGRSFSFRGKRGPDKKEGGESGKKTHGGGKKRETSRRGSRKGSGPQACA